MRIAVVYIVSGLLLMTSCGPATSSYPSYEETVAKYSLEAELEALRLTDPGAYPISTYCDCPRVWYAGHWVYYYHGRWIYWYDDYWYYYPHFYVYYYDGYPYVHTGHGRSITKGPSPKSSYEAAPPAKGAVKRPQKVNKRPKRD